MKNTWRFGKQEIKYIKEVLSSGLTSSTSGDMCLRFEKAFAKKVGAKFAISFNSGTSTMHSCLAAVGVGPGDEVIVPALTVISTANVAVYQKAIPVFADIDPKTFTIDPLDIERKITKKTKAIIPVALYGQAPDLDPIIKLAQKYHLAVINDAAQAVFAKYKRSDIARLGHATSYSFESSKHMTTGEGGMVVTDDEELATKIRRHSSQGYKAITSGDGRVRLNKDIFQDPSYKRHDSLGWNYRMPEICAAMGLAQLEKIDHFIDLRTQIANAYLKAMRACTWLVPQLVPPGYVNTYYTVAATFEHRHAGWQEFRKKYIEFGGDGIYAAWSPVYLEPVYASYNFYGKGWPHTCSCYSKNRVEYKRGLCPITEEVQPKLMQFVNNYGSIKEVESKVEALKKTIKFFS